MKEIERGARRVVDRADALDRLWRVRTTRSSTAFYVHGWIRRLDSLGVLVGGGDVVSLKNCQA